MSGTTRPEPNATAPANVVVVLLDSLNRHMLGAYGSVECDTPNLDRFARRALRFDRHFTGSLPCIPARHDILCGALDFLWRPWGSIEVWEDSITYHLRRARIPTMLVTDHPHLFEVGGENYHTDFYAWEYARGHESDPWRTRPDPSWTGTPALPAQAAPVERQYDRARTWFRDEEDFPGPKTMTAAARWLREEAPAHERWLLFIDEFDPHEPFDTPETYTRRYDPDWEGPLIIWPPYTKNAVSSGAISQREAEHIRALYSAKLTMIDHWFGRVLDELDAQNLWESTAVFVLSDHGHYLGEKDLFGKPNAPVYNTLGLIPMLVAWPGAEPRAIEALTTSVDIFATLCRIFDVTPEHRTHGHSLIPLITGAERSVREWALTGYWSGEVTVVDAHRKYVRTGDTFPLSLWSNRWSTMPLPWPEVRLPRPDGRARLDRMPGSSVPVIRQPFRPGDMLPYWAAGENHPEHLLFDHTEDPEEERNLAGTPLEEEYVDLLRAALEDVQAPDDHDQRLNLT